MFYPRWVFELWALGSVDMICANDMDLPISKATRVFWLVRGHVLHFLFGWWWERPQRKIVGALEWLVHRCNEMDITEQMYWLGDAIKPYEAKLELDNQRTRLKVLWRWLVASMIVNAILLIVLAVVVNY